MPTANQLANLRPPMRPGEMRSELLTALAARTVGSPQLLSNRLLIALLDRLWPEKHFEPALADSRRHRREQRCEQR